jgi:GYF domain 2
MRMYFINDKSFNEGPFDIESLKHKNIQRDTPIWFDELGQWVTAQEIEELEFLFENNPTNNNNIEINNASANLTNPTSYRSSLNSFAAIFIGILSWKFGRH